MDQTRQALEMRRPVTITPLALLGAMVTALLTDAERCRKAERLDCEHPAVADRMDAAESIARVKDELFKRSWARWNEYNNRGQR